MKMASKLRPYRCIRLTIGAALVVFFSHAAFASDILWGVNGHPITAYPGIDIGRQLDYLKDLGARSYRVNITDEAGAEVLASLVEEGKKRGIDILPVITPGGLNLDRQDAEQLYNAARKLAITLGSQFRDQIRVWELGNELENYAIINPCEMRDDGTKYPCEWGPAGGDSKLDYFGPRWRKASAVLKGLSDGMTAVDPTIRKALGSAGWGHIGMFERMQEDGISWDISVWHMYGDDPEWAFRQLAKYNKPIWVTEFNNPYGSQGSEQQQAEGLKRDMQRLRNLQGEYRVEAAHIYELLDETYWAPGYEAQMGLVGLVPTTAGGWTTGEPKQAYDTVRQLIRGPRQRPSQECDVAQAEAAAPGPARQAHIAYCLILGRNGNMDEINRWTVAVAKAESSLPAMLLSIFNSDEFSGLNPTLGLSNRAYVNFLFRLLLGRDADNAGLESYARQLSDGSMSRDGIAYAIVQSSEFRARHAALFDTDAKVAAPPG